MAEESKPEETQEQPVEDSPQEKTQETPSLEKPVDKMTVKELREMAKEIPGVTGVTAMKKEELLELIKEEKGIEEEKPAKEKVKKVKPGVRPADLKKKIARLREEKEQARQARDRKKVDVLRLRINRLKKQTRKTAQG